MTASSYENTRWTSLAGTYCTCDEPDKCKPKGSNSLGVNKSSPKHDIIT